MSRIDPLTNTITLGRREDLETRTVELERVSFVAGAAPHDDDVPGRSPDPPSRDAGPAPPSAERATVAWTVDDGRAGLGGRAWPGGGALRR